MIPLPYKIIAALALALSLVAAGYWRGYSNQHDALVSYRVQVAAAAAAQAQTAKIQEGKNDANTRTVSTNYASDSEHLGAVLGRLHKPAASRPGSLPGAAVNPGIVGASGVQQAGTGQGACDESADDPCLVGRGIFDAAMKDALAWGAVQDWVVRVGIPVK